MERISSAQPPPGALDLSSLTEMDFPVFMYKPRRGVKRGDDSKETYKLPHRLIEKKRRDRINECISQLKDLLPEQLKLTTLGHLEKAVVLELTLKHVKALNLLLEQQRQQILQLSDHTDGADGGEMFRSGFDLCAKEVLQYLRSQESGSDHLTPSCVISHIHKVAADVLQFGIRLHPESVPHPPDGVKKPTAPRASEGHAKNCVPVIQRTCPNGTGEQSGSDTDTDSGYGGEQEKREFKVQWSDGDMRGQQLSHILSERTAAAAIKREGDKPHAKRLRSDSSEEELLSRQMAGGPGSYTTFSPSQPPFCLPFYLLSPTAAAAAYLPMLEKCWYPGGVPVMYPSASLSPVSLVTSWWADSPAAAQTPRESAATASD